MGFLASHQAFASLRFMHVFLVRIWWLLFWGKDFFSKNRFLPFIARVPHHVVEDFPSIQELQKIPELCWDPSDVLKVFENPKESLLTLGFVERVKSNLTLKKSEFWAIYQKNPQLWMVSNAIFGVRIPFVKKKLLNFLWWPRLRSRLPLPRFECWCSQNPWGFMRSSFKTRTSSRRRFGIFWPKNSAKKKCWKKGCNL